MATRREVLEVLVGAAASSQVSSWIKHAVAQEKEEKEAKQAFEQNECLVKVSIFFEDSKLDKTMPLFDFVDFKNNKYRDLDYDERRRLSFLEAFTIIDEINAARV